ncbi:glutathione S-transferase family protein [Ensifer sp. YR511]|uniref:glutathione S-transferase family protein n=1 Tax=Ensifer sp. YR511 TaxID=1855294 RepID=UPI0008851EAF|nr:glutathione S-transferase N-terminal domain-containing protein [Ensifer sp. YR511]SDN41053.1 Glutathione S-transferase [Ensifer sp. YR511]
MKILHGKLSPFVRKAMICAIEKGLENRVEIEPAAVGQGKINEDLLKLNPTGKIPTLITDDGDAIYDSLVICDYLDSVVAEPRFVPAEQRERTRALTMNAAADGLIVAGVLAMLEKGKPAERQWPEFEAAQWAKVEHCIGAIDKARAERGDKFDIGAAAALCALGWLDARAQHIDWRGRYAALATWADAHDSRDSVSRTRPPKS